ncbi:MAG: transketolase [Planctomycetes bacterium]|nr:transketolase [Planctomycetota bacterium]
MSQLSTLEALAINTVRTLSIDAIERANSGHPGLPLGAAPMAYALWQNHLRFDPTAPDWADRDRFVLSAGHGSMLLYSLLHLYGYDLALEEIQRFRQWRSKTPGHPEFGLTPGVEATTGPLAQGSANAVGMAIAERFLAQNFNRPDYEVVDHRTFALVSDGDLMEGLSAEAASLAGHLGLGKLIYLYDSNDVSLDGPLSLSFSEDVAKRYEAHGWHVQHVADGDHDLVGLDQAIESAIAEESRPSLIIVKTTIGFGSPNKGGSSASHGAPLGKDEVALTKKALGWKGSGEFQIPREAREHFHVARERGKNLHGRWKSRWQDYKTAHPALSKQLEQALAGDLPEGWDADLPHFEAGTKVATRASGGKILNALAENIPWLVGGDADLSCSTKTLLANKGDFDGRGGNGRNIRFGIREHAMGAIANGMAYHGGVRTFTGTFFVFSDYMRPAIRLAAMNHLPVCFVFTHDSIAVGEDGPTHQPVEHLMSLRAMPGLVVLRPCEANEVLAAWRLALSEKERPVALVLSRQGLPTLEDPSVERADSLRRGAYVLRDPEGVAVKSVLIATGAEVHLALEAQKELASMGIGARVVSMPSWELFEEQGSDYHDSVLPPDIGARVSIEAGVTLGWQRWIGRDGVAVGLDRFGASAPGDLVLEQLGFTTERVVRTVQTLLG